MNKIIPIVLVSLSLLVAQTDAEVKQAKEVIKKTSMTQSEVRAAAKAQGYTNKQIDAAMQKELNSKSSDEKLPSQVTDKSVLPDLGKSNEPAQEKPLWENIEPISGEQLEIMDGEELEVIDD